MKIAIATCRDSERAHQSDVPLVEACRRIGMQVDHLAWNEPTANWRDYAACVIRSTWDWQLHVDQFRSWLRHVSACSRLFNPLEVCAWGLDKRYLAELEAAGVAIAPTFFIAPANAQRIPALAAERGWRRIVLKPSLGAGAHRAAVLNPDAAEVAVWLDANRDYMGEILVQPFLPAIGESGEVSLICIDGAVSHAIRKRPARGDFRVQRKHGGTVEPAQATQAELAVARMCLASTPGPWLYARVDLVNDELGCPRVMEFEVLEPELFYEFCPQAAERLARAVVKRIE